MKKYFKFRNPNTSQNSFIKLADIYFATVKLLINIEIKSLLKKKMKTTL